MSLRNGINLPLFKNSDGKKDGIWSLTVLIFLLLSVQLLAGGSNFKGSLLGVEIDYRIPSADVTVVSALATTCLTYLGRRNNILARGEQLGIASRPSPKPAQGEPESD